MTAVILTQCMLFIFITTERNLWSLMLWVLGSIMNYLTLPQPSARYFTT